MASPRSLQVSPLVCCHRAVPLCCSLVAVVSPLLKIKTTANATMDVGITTRKDGLPVLVESIFTKPQPNSDVFFEKRSGLTRRVWFGQGKIPSPRGAVHERPLEWLDAKKGKHSTSQRGRAGTRTHSGPASYLNGQNFNIGVEELSSFPFPNRTAGYSVHLMTIDGIPVTG